MLQERLAVGGMSEVFLARGTDARAVVVKLLGTHLAKDPVFHDLMRAEAAIGRRLAHPNVVAVIDQGDDHGEPYVVMEHVDGVDLFRLQKALQRTQRRMEAPLGCYVVQHILAGLSQIHAMSDAAGRSLVHRDVSPSNVLLSGVGDIKLADFGIAAPLRTSPSHTTRGKIGYMAAEQLLGGTIDHRVDLFATGVVLAEVLTGRPLFTPGTDIGQMLAVRDAQVRQLIDVLADHPPSLVSVVLRALARSPAERFQSAQEFRSALNVHAGDATECRQLLSSLVGWARAALRTIPKDSRPPGESLPPAPLPSKTRTSPPRAAAPERVYEEDIDPERTREVPLVMYDVRTEDGEIRGRFTYARLVELALEGALSRSDRVQLDGADEVELNTLSDVAQYLPAALETTSEVANVAADWADALPSCTFLHALARRVLSRDSGLLSAENPERRREVYIVEGRVVSVVSNTASESLGEVLVGQSVITRDELNMTLAVMPKFDGRLDKALVALGLMTDGRLGRVMDDAARAQLLDLFTWRRGTWRFFRDVSPPVGAIAFGGDSFAMLVDGAQRVDNPMAQYEASIDRLVTLGDTATTAMRIPLSPLAQDLLSNVDGRSNLRQLVNRVSTERKAPLVEVFRSLYLLTETGAVTLSH